jgi:hypothetical protein
MKKILILMAVLPVIAMSFTNSVKACGSMVTIINKSDNCIKFFANDELVGTVNPASWGEIDATEDLKEIKAVDCKVDKLNNKVAFTKIEYDFSNDQIVYPNDFE